LSFEGFRGKALDLPFLLSRQAIERGGFATMEKTMSDAKVVLAEEGRKLNVVGDTITIKLRGADTGGAYAVIEELTPPQGGPPLHVHRREDETFFVLEGEFEFSIGGRGVRAGPGTTLFGPRGIPHTFKNVGAQNARMLVTISPPGFERFFEEVDLLSQQGPPAPERLLPLARKYELEILPPPVAG
jgi:mannose-6-phosphate isomerase-like protein (cupin superfamily)